MKVITVINSKNFIGFNLLRLSCALNDLELIVLVSEDEDFVSNRLKDNLLKDYLASDVASDEVILFTDGIDTVLMAGEEEILMKFREANRDIVFSCESACWPDTGLAGQHSNPDNTPYKYLNSGGFIGKAGTIRKFLEEYPLGTDKFPKSNQYVWMIRYLANPEIIGLDTQCELFHTFSPEVGEEYMAPGLNYQYLPYYLFMKQWFTSNFLVQNGRIYSKITKTWPCQAHFNGNSKCLLDYDIINMVFGQIPGLKQPKYIYESDKSATGRFIANLL